MKKIMKYFEIKYYMKGSDKGNYGNYRGVDYIQRETQELAEEFATTQASKNREYIINEISKNTYDFYSQD